MKEFVKEVDANYVKFRASWRNERDKTQGQLDAYDAIFRGSYRRITSLQAWRATILEQVLTADSLAFFLEAQNDALVSHALAQMGAWRSALKSLRSCLENAVVCLYYKDHPVELQLWHKGKHRLGFTAGMEYLKGHPVMDGIPPGIAGLEAMSREYGVLSRAVHASAASFRMTADGSGTMLWSAVRASVGSWATRETAVVLAVNLVLLCFFRNELEGARLPGLRHAVSLGVPVSKHAAIKSALKVSLSAA